MEVSGKSILDGFGSEITAIVTPVSVCMLLVVVLVRCLTPNGSVDDGPVIGALVYQEQRTDSDFTKFEGALLNASIFIVAVALITFVLVACFWLRCNRLIWVYMGFSGFTILAWMGGSVAIQLIQLWSIPIDVFSFALALYNFSVVGVIAVFFCRLPIFLTQTYLVIIGAIVAFWFTHLPEWTTWLLLVAMAAYDLVAVLMPGGPLKMLVEMAMERNESIPALVYEARPQSVKSMAGITRSETGSNSGEGSRAGRRRSRKSERLRVLGKFERRDSSSELDSQGSEDLTSAIQPPSATDLVEGVVVDSSHVPSSSTAAMDDDDELLPLVSRDPEELSDAARQDAEVSLPSSIKLGLGDFIFYSVLVGRAAMFDLMTVYACYLSIIAGLGATLVLLAVFRKALPALPISIALGVSFYFLTRLVMDPFIVTLSSNLIFI